MSGYVVAASSRSAKASLLTEGSRLVIAEIATTARHAAPGIARGVPASSLRLATRTTRRRGGHGRDELDGDARDGSGDVRQCPYEEHDERQ